MEEKGLEMLVCRVGQGGQPLAWVGVGDTPGEGGGGKGWIRQSNDAG